MKKVINNARNGIKTTILGIILFIATLAYLFVPMYLEATHSEFHYGVNLWILGGGMALGIGFILMPDTILGLMTGYLKKKVGIVLILSLPCLASCASYSKCVDKYGHLAEDTVYVHHVDTILHAVERIIPGDSLFTSIQLDSLLMANTEDTVELISADGYAKVQFWKDKYNNYLNANFIVPERIVYDTVLVPVEIQIPCPPVLRFEDNPSWMERKVLNWINPWYVLLFVVGMTAWLIVRFLR